MLTKDRVIAMVLDIFEGTSHPIDVSWEGNPLLQEEVNDLFSREQIKVGDMIYQEDGEYDDEDN